MTDLDEMAAYVTACRRQGDRRDALTIVATSGVWTARQIASALKLWEERR
jgi:hypothetical protein